MRREAEAKDEVLRLVEGSPLTVIQTLRQLNLAPSTYYRWKRKHSEGGMMGLKDRPSVARSEVDPLEPVSEVDCHGGWGVS